MIGALMNHIHTPSRNFQPMNANMGILPSGAERSRKGRYLAKADRAVKAMRGYRKAHAWLFDAESTRAPGKSPANFA
jgi:folate-dependent tRNA-U54 methylase TrmFO/GidA